MQQVVDLTASAPHLYEFETGGGHYQPCDAQICAALTAAAAEGRNEVTVQWHFHGEPQLHSFDFSSSLQTNLQNGSVRLFRRAADGATIAPRRDGTTDSQLARRLQSEEEAAAAQLAADAALALSLADASPPRGGAGPSAAPPDVDRMSYEELLAWERSRGQVSVGLRGDLAARLPLWRFGAGGGAGSSGGDDATCPICLEEYAAGDELITFPCAHVYHAKCGTEWLRHKPNCPTCQFDVAEALKRA